MSKEQHKEYTILIVDDTPQVLELAMAALSDWGYKVLIASNGQDGINIAISSRPDLILLDIMMPVVSGFDVCQTLKSNESTSKIPIIFISALSDGTDKEKGFNLGACDYLTKPIDLAEFRARVDIHLKLSDFTHNLEKKITDKTEELEKALETLKANKQLLEKTQSLAKIGSWEYCHKTHAFNATPEYFHILSIQESDTESQNPLQVLFNVLKESGTIDSEAVFNKSVMNNIDYDMVHHFENSPEEKYINIRWHTEYDNENTPEVTTGLVHDITTLKKIEIEKEKAEYIINQRQKMDALGTLARGIAHDFNNILGAIIGYTGIVRKQSAGNELLEKAVSGTMEASNRAKKLIRQILTFSKDEEEHFGPLRIKPVIEEVLALLKITIPRKITVEVDLKTDSIIYADSTQMHQVILNICTNAIHAIEGEGRLSVTLEERSVRGDEECFSLSVGTYAVVTIADTGTGISNENLERIFDPFFTTKTGSEGTGLGLSVVHGIVKKIGGDISVDSKEGVGTIFYTYIPVAER